jgi:threonine dehydrogenase-like Zn-dependent dehydrogenase
MQLPSMMRASLLEAPGRAVLQTLPRPEPRDNQVRVRLEGCGVCGSNLAPWEGRPWFKYPLPPGEPGHEGWGIVDAVGPVVTTVRRGERVAVLAYHSFAEYDLAPEENLVPLPSSLDSLPFPGEALGCAMNVFARCEIRSGQNVAVVGVGFLGALLVQLAAKAGARVAALSRRPFALEMAKLFGAAECIPMDDHGRAVGRAREFSNDAGFDCVIEAAGLQWPLDVASEITKERGRLVIAGYHQDGPRQVNMQLWNWRGLDVINAHERDPKVYVTGMRAAVKAASEGGLNFAPLLTHRFPLDELGGALESMRLRPGNFMKAFVTL